MTVDSPMMWVLFFIVVIVMFAIDLGVASRGDKHISIKKATKMTIFWIGLALAFGLFIYSQLGTQAATEYYTAYVIEEMMSIDNLFVFIVIMAHFAVPDEYQHKVLFYGVIGAFAFRALFIFLGVELLNAFDWMMYIFGAILIYTAIRTLMKKEQQDENKLALKLSKRFNVCPHYDGDKLFTVWNGVKMITPLFLCIVVIELTDIMFAFDSIPAVLGITTDMFIVYTSNMFAVLGLRSLYFVIKGAIEHMEYLKYGIGIILAFVGAKMLLSNHYHVDVLVSLAFILTVLAVTIAISLYMRRKEQKKVRAE